MGVIRPATPGFLVTLLAAVLLGVVTFSVPYFKSVYFLKASLENEGITGSVTFGTLGFCMHLQNGTTCSKPSIGYSLNINALVGDSTPIQIPNVVVKWITYALVLHVVALIFAAIGAFFGLLAHVREFAMTCCSTCLSGVGAATALLAFIFDLAFFFVAKSRINAVKGGSASIGIGIWLTLAAWLLLFFAGCFFGLGRCCIRRRPRDRGKTTPTVDNAYAEQVRMDAIRAENDRKFRQAKVETGLPAFAETTPLTKTDSVDEFVEEGDHIVPYRPNQNSPPNAGAGVGAYGRQPKQYSAGGYAQAPAGTRAVDDYYNAQPTQQSTYPPKQPNRQLSTHTVASSHYSQSSYNPGAAPPVPTLPSTMPSNQYLSAGAPYGGHSQYPTAASQDYGHPERGTTYHSAASHQQYPTTYSQYPEHNDASFNSEAYNTTGQIQTGNQYAPQSTAYNPGSALYAAASTPYGISSAYANASTGQHAPERSYTLGGDNYTPQSPHQQHPSDDAAYYQPASSQSQSHYSTSSHMPSPYSPMPSPGPSPTSSSVARMRSMHKPPLDLPPAHPHPGAPSPTSSSRPQQRAYEEPLYEDSPPVYDDATSQPPGEWNSKR